MKRGILVLVVFVLILNIFLVSGTPFGANVTEERSERHPADDPTSIPARAGNVTELNIHGYSITSAWQGYFGNVSGSILLGDASGNIMYNWSVASPEGEVYASTNSSIDWNYVQCFNFTATGDHWVEGDLENAGGTSLYGTNLTQLESRFNIRSNAPDSISNTFSLDGSHESGGGFVHNTFFTNNLRFDEGQCPSTHIFTSSGPEDNKFQQTLLYEPTTSSVIFTSLLNPSTLGFDNNPYDFQMLVLDDGHGDNTETTPYYFYIEIE